MNRKALKTCLGIVASTLGLLLGAPGASAQTANPPANPGDWPALGAYQNRQGRNGDPFAFSPGKNELRWTTPFLQQDRALLTLDNTDIAANYFSNAAPANRPNSVDDPQYGEGSVSFTAGWRGPQAVAQEAGSPFLLPRRSRLANTPPAGYTVDRRDRAPSYLYTEATPQLKGSADPTAAANPADLRYFEWTFTQPVGADRNYGLYVYLPVGATYTGAGTALTDRKFPQRYFVYKIFYGNGQSYTEILDTETSGTDFVRLGNGGLSTQRVFPFNTVTGTPYPIRVRLYNTVPRYSDGSLAITGSSAFLSAEAELALARTRLTYADAARLRPQLGEYRASPVTQTFAAGTAPDGTIDAHVAAALNLYETSSSNNTLQQSTAGTVISYQSNPARWIPNAANARTTPLEVWRYALNENATNARTVDNVDNPGGAWTADTANPYHIGANYLQQPAVIDPANTQSLTYAPVLDDGDYSVYVYLGGSRAGINYARSVVYSVFQGATLVDTVTLNQDRPRVNSAGDPAPGWIRLGGRRYRNVRDDQDTTDSAPLRVVVTNYSTNANDLGRFVYADAVRFVGLQNSAINSTPVHATARINNVDTRVVLVADESGKIHCLDARGNDDGTTREYWSYPSTPQGNDLSQYRDPNLFEIVNSPSGIDGVPNGAINPGDNTPTATMPTSFDLSSAVVKRIDRGGGNVVDYLYIGASNGRVYCIDMAGRNDSTPATIGTTRRIWTYPDDYNPTNPSGPIGASDLGPFRGSIVVGDATGPNGAPTVYVPAYQGRIYALDALGNGASRTTNVVWRYPEAEISPLPNILMTPTLFGEGTANPRLFFGTLRSTADDGPGRFYCLNATTGDIVWRYNGGVDQNVADIHDTATTIRRTATDVFSAANGYDPDNISAEIANFGAFVTGVVAVPGTILDQNPSTLTANPPVHVDTVYALNNNRFLYAFNAANGAPLTFDDTAGRHYFASNDLDVLSDGNLTFTVTTAPNRTSTFANSTLTGTERFPVILVPSNDGRMREAFARTEDYNVFEGRVADGLNFPNPLTSAAASNNSTYLGDTEGNLYALDDKGAEGLNLLLPPTFYGVNPVIPPNDPRGRAFRNLKIRLVNRTAYNLLKNLNENNQGALTYADATANPAYQGPASPHTFEWGETAYVLVYGFPYTTQGANGETVSPPNVTITLSTEGRTVRQIQADSHSFLDPQSAPTIPGTSDPRDQSGNTPYREDGYAIIPFTFNSAGSTALPPGPGRITATLSTASAANGGVAEVLTDTRPNRGPAIAFGMANPLAVQVFSQPGRNAYLTGIGNTANANDEENRVNGSPNIGLRYFNQLLASAGEANHGASATARFYVTDRSLMVLVRPEGLNNVRLQRSNLERQGGVGSAFHPLNPALYPNFEDLGATTYRPNRSLDYPNIGREQVRAVKDPGGNAENPLLTSVTLIPPRALGGGELTEATLGANNERSLQTTTFEFMVDVPRYQPAVILGDAFNPTTTVDVPTDLMHKRRDYTGNFNLPQGYFGKAQIYVDSNNDQVRNAGTSNEAYRSFNYSVAVAPQASILVGTPTVDLNSLAAGTGYAPLNPSAAGINASYDPWTGQWRDAYQPIVVRNDGNVNLLDLRPVKATNSSKQSISTANNEILPIYAEDSDPLAFLAAALLGTDRRLLPGDLWSNFDTTFAPANRHAAGDNRVILQKPRVTDRNPTELAINPAPRPNPNIPTNGGRNEALNLNFDRYGVRSQPTVGVSIPLGFPVGNYSTDLRIVENLHGDGQTYNQIDNETDAYSDPITLTFKVRESRLTNRSTTKTAPMIDDPANFPNNTTRPAVGNAPFAGKVAFRNGGAGAMRTPNGSLVVAFPSDRLPDVTDFGSATNPTRLFFAGVNNGQISLAGTSAPAGNAPLWDLNQFNVPNGATQWFTPGNAGAPFPSLGYNGFGGGTVRGTEQYDSPSFPVAGGVNPLRQNEAFDRTLMGFVGNAQVQTPTGRLAASRVFLVPVTVNGGQVSAADGDIVPVPGDLQTAKGKPSVVQTNTGALVFYSETSGGQSGITVSRYRGGNDPFTAPMALNFGDGFSSVFSPSATVRQYRTASEGMVELAFAGKLRGRPNAEVYLARLRYDVGTGTLNDGTQSIENRGSGSPFRPMAVQTSERLVNEGNGLYRARGVLWTLQSPIALSQSLNGPSVFVGDPTVDRQSGLVVYNSVYGGKVYLDPDLGTVKFTGGTPPRSAELRLTYTPTFLRITPGGPAGYSAVNGLWDHRYVSDYRYWYNSNGAGATPELGLRNDRYYFAYGRGAAGNGQTARPYSTSMRLGVRLPTRVYSDQDGNIGGVTVVPTDGLGPIHPYQVDPANGRVYFQAIDEDRTVRIDYTGVNEGTNAAGPAFTTGAISFVLERAEAPIPVEEATNDSAITAFLDPFSFQSTSSVRRERPPLIWLFYTSTRAGGPDVYFQTIAPQFSPLPK